MLSNIRIALIGGGNMTEALVAGMLRARLTTPDCLLATDILPERRSHLRDRYRIKVGSDNAEAAGWGEIVVLSVEPQVLDGVLNAIQCRIHERSLIISVAAGYPIARIRAHLSSRAGIVRVMPNTPSSVLAGVAALAIGSGVSEEQAAQAGAMFEAVGKVVDVEERLMDAVTGLSGSGPAYVYVMIEALADGGVKAGLPREVAELLATQTVLGTARLVLETGEHPARWKDRIASPGGTTMAGLHALEAGRLRACLMAAVEAAAKRSAELGIE